MRKPSKTLDIRTWNMPSRLKGIETHADRIDTDGGGSLEYAFPFEGN